MKPFLFVLFLTIALCCCRQRQTSLGQVAKDTTQSVLIDSHLQDSLQKHIQLISDKHSSFFKTPIEARFFSNNVVVDSVIESDFEMSSWYSSRHDTVDLVAHVGEFETEALLLRFVGGQPQPQVYFFRAPHERQTYFRLHNTDTFARRLEVPPVYYKLQLSQTPDTTNKPVVYGYIDMESQDYFDRRGSLQQTQHIQMKFYFRSQHRHFDY